MRGFTLVEMLLAVALLAAIAGISLPLYTQFSVRTDLAVARDSFLAHAHAARGRAQHNIHDGQWGVTVTGGSIVLFQGSSFESRDEDHDDLINIADSITISGDSEFVFEQLTGEVDQEGGITLTSVADKSITITLNEKGIPTVE